MNEETKAKLKIIYNRAGKDMKMTVRELSPIGIATVYEVPIPSQCHELVAAYTRFMRKQGESL